MNRPQHPTRPGLLLYTALLGFSALMNTAHSDGTDVICFQGSVETNSNNKISLSPESLSNLQISPCVPPTTTTLKPIPTTKVATTPVAGIETMMVTDMTTSGPDLTTAGRAPSTATPVPAAPTTTPQPPTTTPQPPTTTPQPPTTTQPTTQPQTTAPNVTTAAAAATTLPPPGNIATDAVNGITSSARRRRRDATPEPTTPEPATEPQFYCHISYGPTEGTGGKLKVNSTHTLQFYCQSAEETDDMCKNNTKNKSGPDDQGRSTYCCTGDSCNTPLKVITDKENMVELKKITDCNHRDEMGAQAIPCIAGVDAYMCLNQTNNDSGEETWSCAYKILEETYCIENDWFLLDTCKTANSITTCCYFKETDYPGAPTKTPPAPASPASGGSNTASIFIAVTVAFATGLFGGCILLVIVQKKCRNRQGGDDLMDFSYSRFQSAENSTNEL